MDDRKIVNLSQRRAEDRKQQRRAALSRFRPGASAIAWAVLLAVAVLGFFWSGASSRFEKAPSASYDVGPSVVR
jgi:hypothetical protein